MDETLDRPIGVVMLMWVYLLAGLIILTTGSVMAFDGTAVSDVDKTFIWFFMIIGSILSLFALVLMYKKSASAWYVGVAVCLIKLMYCLFLAVSVPEKTGVFVIVLAEIFMFGLLMMESTRKYLLN